jgi:predicted MFS family arabinose efflux permease
MASPIPVIEAEGSATGTRRPDITTARIPPYALAVMEALRFSGADGSRLGALAEADWSKLLAFCDRAQLTLTLNHVCRNTFPQWVQDRIDQNVRDYGLRFERLETSLLEIANMLESRGIEFIVLKGVAHSPYFTPDPLLRVQGDIDILCNQRSVIAARDALAELGYRPIGRRHGRHLPPMIRETHWEWRGNYYAADLPIPVELHYQLWDEQAELVPASGERQFWDRQTTLSIDSHRLPVLFKPDTLAFASLHLLIHLLHGDLRLQRAWEIGNFLHTHVHSGAFWSVWKRCHGDSLRRLQAIVFQLVSDLFGAELAPAARAEIEQLPGDVKLWLERYALSPVEGLFHPNKDEVWLHLSLVESFRGKCWIFLRRVLPLQAAARVDAETFHRGVPTLAQFKRYLSFAGSRAVHHTRALIPSLLGGAKWYWIRNQFGGGFLRLQAASALFCLGVFIFFLLYNLYLLRLGFREDLLGRVSSCVSLGTVLGAGPAAVVTRRMGLRSTLLVAILGSATAILLRTLSTQEAWLLATAFLNGLFLSLWAISFSPAIAGLTNEQNRPPAFSLACAFGVAVGVLGGVVGGRLPGLLGRILHLSGPLEAERLALVAASGIAAMAVFPAARLRFAPVSRTETRIYPRGRFVIGFLVSLLCWSAAVGAFNPFFNAFFAQRLGMSVERIGVVLSSSQVLQVAAMLSAPMVLRRLGQVRGIASMQLAAGLALAFLAFSSTPGIAAAGYMGYMSFQYMSEPGLFTMLMNGVAPGERSGASALYFVVTSLAGSISAIVAGSAVVRFGYPSVLIAAALVAATAAFLFRTLVHEQACTITSATSC